MDLVKAKQFAERTLRVIHPLIKKVKQPTKFSSIILGALRRDYLTLYTIARLSDADEQDRTAFGDSCVDLTRRVFEDLINIEYIKLKGKEKYSKQFIDFKAVEAHQDLQYLKALNVKMDPKFVKQTEEEYEKLPKKLRERKRWSGVGIEEMIQILLDEGVIKEDEFRTLLQTYIAGNYKNHFSPTGIFNFLHNDLYQFSGKSDLIVGLVVTSISVTKLAEELIEEAGVKGKVKDEVNVLWKDWLVAHQVD
ncbi:MAG: DUF5677 domain-containing protein [Candidatus Woesebacteria bacterium]|jgi:hypothetical protein